MRGIGDVVVESSSGFLDNLRLAFGMLTCQTFFFTNATAIPYREQLMQAL